jgi:hypothetical protein
MAHNHEIKDTDVSFVIDPITRAITTESSKLYLAQYDHNSERYTFKIPRSIESHDLSHCDTILIDYTNTDKKKTSTKRGAFKVNDVVVEDDNILFTWLVSREATQLVGYLTFSVAFRCHDAENNIIYEWGTDKFSKITIIEKTRYDQSILAKIPDLIDQIRTEVRDALSSKSKITVGNVELLADKWVGAEKMYSQVVSLDGVNEYSQVDLTPSIEQLAVFHDKDLAFVTENDGGIITVYVLGDKPTNDYTMQVTIKEVSVWD